MKKRVLVTLVLLAAAAAVYWFFLRDGTGEYAYRTEPISRGPIEKVVRATGTINPIQTVKVGSQVSGTVSKLFVDFNARVKAGQIIAVIDSTFLAASVREAEANLQRSRAQLNEADRAFKRTKELFAKDLVSQADLDAALTTYETSNAQMRQTEAALERAYVNLRYAVIRSPIDGIVVSRDVDVGQTVAASLQAPQLFAIANDLSRMQVEASVDEADIGQIDTAQTATFTVDAYPDENFEGRVTQVRLSPINVQNVVTYTVIIEVANVGGKLRPGMTATASILIDQREDVLRLPAVATRFQPPADVLEAYNREAASDSSAGGGRGGDVARAGERPREGAGMGPGGSAGQAGQRDSSGQRRRGGERRSNRGEGTDGRSGGRDGGQGGDGQRQSTADGQGQGGMRQGGDPAWRRAGGMRGASLATVWVLGEGDKLRRVMVRTGLTDQRYIELIGDRLKEGDRVILGVSGGAPGGNQQRPGGSPFQQQIGGPQGGGRRGM